MQICLINKILAMIKDEIFSVNSDFSEFDLQQLEERLETDPLVTGIRTMGFSPFLRYLLVAVLLHATVLNLTDYFSFHRIGMILLKSISDTLATIVCILCIEAIRRKH